MLPLGLERMNEKDFREHAGAHTAGACLSWWKWEVRLPGELRKLGVRLATSVENMLVLRVTCIGD